MLALRSSFSFAFYGWIFERSLKSDFHAVRLSKAVPPPEPASPKLVLYSSHPSWWDAVIYVFLVRRLFSGRFFRAPIDAAMLERYAFMERIGTFGVEQGTRRGAADFIAICRELFKDPRNLLMITAQGRFADIRERPLGIEPGIAHIADIDPEISFVPLAVEYCFWTERQPELLIRFGGALSAAELASLPVPERRERLEQALEATMDALAVDAIARNADAFRTLVEGKRGVHPFYDLWRRALALFRGRAFDPQHGVKSE